MSGSTKPTCNSKKRPLPRSSVEGDGGTSTSSGTTCEDNLIFCGICHEPIHEPVAYNDSTPDTGTGTTAQSQPPSIGITLLTDPYPLDVVTCANVACKCCKAVGQTSPHFHFACLKLPKGSKIYTDLTQFLRQHRMGSRRKLQCNKNDSRHRNRNGKEIKPASNANANGGREIRTDMAGNKATNAKAILGAQDRQGGDEHWNIVSPLSSRRSSDTSNGDNDANHDNTNHHQNQSNHDIDANDCIDPTIANPFLCPICDIQGTSKHLYEYFASFRSSKVKFFNDEEVVDVIQPVGTCLSAATIRKHKQKQRSTCQKQAKSARSFTPNKNHVGSNCNMSANTTNDDRFSSDMDVHLDPDLTHDREKGVQIENGFVQYLIFKEKEKEGIRDHGHGGHDTTSPHGISGKNRNTCDRSYSTEITLDHIRGILRSCPHSSEGPRANFDVESINSTFLTGQPIRLFCDVSNCYHTGRIIDSRVIEEDDLERLNGKTKKWYWDISTNSRSHDGPKTVKQSMRAKPSEHGISSSNENCIKSGGQSKTQKVWQMTQLARKQNGKKTSAAKGVTTTTNHGGSNGYKSNREKKNDNKATIKGALSSVTVTSRNNADGTCSTGNNVLLDRDIGRTQYLVRFRARIEGRKIAVQQWIYLEEHPVMVGVSLVWTKLQKVEGTALNRSVEAKVLEANNSPERKKRLKKVISKFRPGQVFVRSALEMLHANVNDTYTNDHSTSDPNNAMTIHGKENGGEIATSMRSDMGGMSKSRPTITAIALLFSRDYYCINLKLLEPPKLKPAAAASTSKSKSMSSTQNSPKKASSTTTASKYVDHTKKMSSKRIASILECTPFDHLTIADFNDPPQDLAQYLQVLRTRDEALVYAITCACIEEEEQMRVILGS